MLQTGVAMAEGEGLNLYEVWYEAKEAKLGFAHTGKGFELFPGKPSNYRFEPVLWIRPCHLTLSFPTSFSSELLLTGIYFGIKQSVEGSGDENGLRVNSNRQPLSSPLSLSETDRLESLH
ncbi:MAG: hypothetical protein JW902_09755 [Syntrophaceae bacterium]|nr:hypothetical protein [Syntrophaceae bacterium]